MGEQNTTSSDPQNATLNGTDPTPATGTPPTDATSGSTTTEPTLDDLKAQVQRMENALKKSNADAKTHRLENEELRKYKETAEQAKLSQSERDALAQQKQAKDFADMQTLLAARELENQELRVNSAIRMEAIRQGLNPDLAVRLLDKATLDHDDNGNPSNLDKAFSAMISTYGLQAGKPIVSSSGGPTNPPRSGNRTEYTRDEAARILASGRQEFDKLTPEEQLLVRQALNPGLHKR